MHGVEPSNRREEILVVVCQWRQGALACARSPLSARPRDVGTVLFAGAEGLFTRTCSRRSVLWRWLTPMKLPGATRAIPRPVIQGARSDKGLENHSILRCPFSRRTRTAATARETGTQKRQGAIWAIRR